MLKIRKTMTFGALVGLTMAVSISTAFAGFDYAEQANMAKTFHDKVVTFIDKVGIEEAIKAFNAPDNAWHKGPEELHTHLGLMVNDPENMVLLSNTSFPEAVGMFLSDIADLDGKPVNEIIYEGLGKSPEGTRAVFRFPLSGTNTAAHVEGYCSYVDNAAKVLCAWTQQPEN